MTHNPIALGQCLDLIGIADISSPIGKRGLRWARKVDFDFEYVPVCNTGLHDVMKLKGY